MMAEKILKTRISHKIDTLENWKASTIGLKKGELAIATVAATEGSGLTEPVVMIKIGEDGVKTFKDLPWNFYAKASDVYSWAKASTKPTYTATEISGLSDYISGEIQDTNTVYRIVKDTSATDKTVYKLQSKASADPDTKFADVKDSTFDIYTAEGINGLIDTKITGLNLDGTYEAKGAAKTVQDALDAYKTDNDKAVAAVKATADKAAVKTEVEAELAKKQDNLAFGTAYNAETNKVATMSDITSATAGLTGAMHFKGEVKSDPTGVDFDKKNYKSGDVVLFGKKEYVFDGTKFVELGDEGSYVLKTTTINGHALSDNVEISKADVGLGNVDNKSEATIKTDFTGEIADKNDGFVKGGDAYTALAGKADSTHTHTASDITDLDVGVTAVAEGKTNGTVSVTKGGKATEVAVAGLKSAAYTESTAYATAAQGAKADTALQAITTTANGGLKVTDNNKIDIDDTITFVFDCGSATEVI